MPRTVRALIVVVVASYAAPVYAQCADAQCLACADPAQCDECQSGYYSSGGSCAPCPSVPFCEDLAPTCGPLGDALCESCQAGYYVDLVGASEACLACSPVMHCTSQVTCTSSADSACSACEAGYWLDDDACSPCTPCQPGTSVVSACSATADTVCETCNPGTYSDAINAPVCLPCAAGTFTDAAQSAVCLPCPPGTNAPGGSTSCASCLGGTATDDGLACTPCPPGTYAPDGAAFCIQCPAGSAAAAEAATCTACGAGSFSPTPGAATCSACPPGYFTDDAGSTRCTPCREGTYGAGPGASSCTPCADGTFALSAATECQPCGDCDDGDACTEDACDIQRGCTHRGTCGPRPGAPNEEKPRDGGDVVVGGGCNAPGASTFSFVALALLGIVGGATRRRPPPASM